ncbi:hypothetical protein [Acinetobacter sp. MD2]|uniref:hypothetical protein n=1 Tax=Acinetobacter sp. MD2 TaxID=2600066 RepID=UPI002D1F77A5|nr:hypothetical protein [Acinetobacter sp. MD2]MEB3766808.1 hypothetical protein [Acinetobacter sp. MD2]
MKKRVLIASLVVLVWLAKNSYDQWQITQQMNILHTQMTQLEQSSANLNDQWVALKRQPTENPEKAAIAAKSVTTESSVITPFNPVVMVKQQLQLVQFALQQQQSIYAFEQLTQLQKQLSTYAIAPALQQSLAQGMTQDLQRIQQYHDLRQGQLDQAHALFSLIDQQLNHRLSQPQQAYQPTNTHFWSRWLTIETASTPKTELMSQRLVLKEAQIRLLLARQAFDAGLVDEYQKSVQQILALLQQAPAVDQQQLTQALAKAKQLQIAAVPTLSSIALLN